MRRSKTTNQQDANSQRRDSGCFRRNDTHNLEGADSSLDDHAQLGQERGDVCRSRGLRFHQDICITPSNSKSQGIGAGNILIWARMGSVEAWQLVKTARALAGCLSGVGVALTSPSARVMEAKKRNTSLELNIMKRRADER